MSYWGGIADTSSEFSHIRCGTARDDCKSVGYFLKNINWKPADDHRKRDLHTQVYKVPRRYRVNVGGGLTLVDIAPGAFYTTVNR